MFFPDLNNRTMKTLLPGIQARTFWAEKMLLAIVDLDAKAIIPSHSHPHEQCGVVLNGQLQFTIAGEVGNLGPGAPYVIPGGVEHSVIVGDEPAQVMDVFSPVREEYKY